MKWGDPLRSGWMRKRGEMNTAWRRRYFALFNDFESGGFVLAYFLSKEQCTRNPTSCKGAVELSAVLAVRHVKQGAGYNRDAIELITKERTWALAPGADEFSSWCASAKSCASVLLVRFVAFPNSGTPSNPSQVRRNQQREERSEGRRRDVRLGLFGPHPTFSLINDQRAGEHRSPHSHSPQPTPTHSIHPAPLPPLLPKPPLVSAAFVPLGSS